MESISLEDLDEVDLLLTELEISRGKRNLILCTVASPAYREKVIEVIKTRFPTRVLKVEKGDNLIFDLRNTQAQKEEILIWTLPETLSNDILDALNNFRELFYDAGVPSLVFMTPAGLDDVIWKAPDFWRYRGGYYILKGEEHGSAYQAVEALSMPFSFSYQNKEDLLRRKRINEYLLQKMQNKMERGKILAEIGAIYFQLSDIRKAIEYCDQALKISHEIGDRQLEVAMLGNIGSSYFMLGQTRKSVEYNEQALKIGDEVGDHWGKGYIMGNLGNAYITLGETRKAIEYCDQAIKISREIGDRRGEAYHFSNLGQAYSLLGNTREAIESYGQALKIAKEIGDRSGEGSYLKDLGTAYRKLGEMRKAVDYYEQSLKIAREIGARNIEGSNIGDLGITYNNLGKTVEAIDYYNQALAIARETEDKRNEGVWLFNLSLAFAALDETTKAIEHAKLALAIFEQIESPHAQTVRKKLAQWQGDDPLK